MLRPSFHSPVSLPDVASWKFAVVAPQPYADGIRSAPITGPGGGEVDGAHWDGREAVDPGRTGKVEPPL